MKNKIIDYFYNSLFRNSLYIMLASISSSCTGFIFWMLAARLYSPEDLGLATAIISSIGVIILLSRLGLDFSIIRYAPTSNKSSIFNTSVIITTTFAIIIGFIFLVGIDLFSPGLYSLKSPFNALLFLAFVALNSFIIVTGNMFVAIRKSEYYLFQNLVIGSRILFIFIFLTFGFIGIFFSFGISFLIASLVALLFLVKSGIKPKIAIDRSFLTDIFHFSAGNYLSALFMAAPNLIFPIMVLNVLGAKEAAHYYIAFAIATFLFMIPSAIGTSLFVEGSHGEALKKSVIKSTIITFSFLVPAVGVLYIFAERILGIAGANYATESIELLRIMIITSLLVATSSIYYTIKRIQKDVSGLVLLSGTIFVFLLGFGYIFMTIFGIMGVGYAWMLSYAIGNIIIVICIWRERWF